MFLDWSSLLARLSIGGSCDILSNSAEGTALWHVRDKQLLPSEKRQASNVCLGCLSTLSFFSGQDGTWLTNPELHSLSLRANLSLSIVGLGLQRKDPN